MAEDKPVTWNSILANLPNAHVLQTWEWAQVKSKYGWQPFLLTWGWDGHFAVTQASPSNRNNPPEIQNFPGRFSAAGLLLQRAIPAEGFAARLRILYLPKGPVLDWADAGLRRRVINDLHNLARRMGAIFIKIDPDIPLGQGIPGQAGAQDDPVGSAALSDFQTSGWCRSAEQVQFANTVLVDLNPPEEELLKRMKQKMRYNINLAMRKGVHIRAASPADLDLLYQMYAETSLRDGFTIRDQDYYHLVWNTLMRGPDMAMRKLDNPSLPIAEPLIAEVEGDPVAAVVIFRFARKAWYFYGMSRQAHRDKMPNALLQWEAMRRAKAAGCTVYDLWGAPDVFDESDPLWGVFRFKEGFGGIVSRTPGAWDLPVRPILYRLYTRTLPRLLAVMRRRGRQRTQQSIGG